mmetsp:Transcript_133881/g.317372  ORF Transcript_133881/g.317372 Transcript_133881/m.317372 type:complete len:197 (-) Transcript_133881:924-1514(-)
MAMKVEKYNSLTGGGRPPWPATSVLRDVELPFADATKIFMQSQVSDGVFGWFSLCGQDRLALEFQMRKELFAIFDLAQGAAVGCTRRKFSADWREELEGTELGFLEMLTTRRANVKTAWQRGPRYPGKTACATRACPPSPHPAPVRATHLGVLVLQTAWRMDQRRRSLWAVLTGNQRHGVDLMSDKNCPTSFVMMT